MYEQNEKFNKHREIVKNQKSKPWEILMTELKNSTEKLNSQFNQVEEIVNK